MPQQEAQSSEAMCRNNLREGLRAVSVPMAHCQHHRTYAADTVPILVWPTWVQVWETFGLRRFNWKETLGVEEEIQRPPEAGKMCFQGHCWGATEGGSNSHLAAVSHGGHRALPHSFP